ncbi:hypothetical protein LY474_30145 [Myxococcus stipitatus]|uniref:hypothetical protein n=1 Tax=Myxococcus stipitatus TaxID=83455 RepID=UPI001F1C1D53|nr:hypothetical protein [Myxococcus stipitatus]MCE9672075.1 hypothetical protein [Myxococcus stipitatus]
MAEPVTVTAAPPANKGMDYLALKEEGTRLIQQLAGDIWTDYNEHDPGVTTLEQLCYALTELSYRAQFPLEDLLLDPVTGDIEPERQALFPALDILPCNPVTERDYRKLLVDRVPGVANAWLTPVPPSEADPVPGLYDIWLYAPGADCCATDGGSPEDLVEAARRVYSRHRALCEDLRDIRLLAPVTATVTAEVSIDERLTSESILAGLFFRLGNFLAPEPRRESLTALLAEGQRTEDIFEGPLMSDGFIADAELQPKATSVSIPDLLQVMVESPGVTSARRVSLRLGESVAVQPDGVVNVPVDQVPALDTRADTRRGGFSIRLFRNGVEVKPNAARVRRELERLWAEQRRTYPLGPQYAEMLPMPKGQRHDFRRYTSIQNQYPLVYGISAAGLPDVANPMRMAQARQLKGYLLVFEQLLADFFAQLARVRDLFSTDPALRHTYFFQLLTGDVPDIEPLLKHADEGSPGYAAGLAQLVASQDPATERRNRFLEVLLALFAERLDTDSIAGGAWNGGTEPSEEERLLEARLALLQHLVRATHDRGRGIDYLERPGGGNMAGMAIKSRIQLGMDVGAAAPLIDVLDELFIDISDTGTPAPESRALARHVDTLEERFTAVASLPAPESIPPEASVPLRARSVSAEFLGAAGALENFRVGTLPGESSVSLVCRAPATRGWHLVGKFSGTAGAVARAHALVEQVRQLNRRRSQLYIVEHVLLRSARRPGDETFPYGFTLTAVISTATSQWSTAEYQSFAREVIRSNAPAHVVADCLFLGPTRMASFERLYWAWRNALREQDESRIATASARLRDFLEVAAQEPEAADA